MIAFLSMTADRDPLEAALGRHLSTRLDGQLGRAEAAFLQHLQQPHATSGIPGDTRSYGWKIGAWALAGSGALLAASIALFALMPVLRGTANSDATPGRVATTGSGIESPGSIAANTDSHTPNNEPLRVRQVVSRMVDDGTYVGDENVPLRRYRLQQVEQRLFYDARTGVRVQVTVPSEGVTYIEMPTY